MTNDANAPIKSTGCLRSIVEPFLQRLAAPAITPAGGSAAAVAAAMAASLCAKVAGLSLTKKHYLQYAPQLEDAISSLAGFSEALTDAIDGDADSYDAVISACRQAKATAADDGLISEALKGATEVPLRVLENARAVGSWAERLKPITIPSAACDLSFAQALAHTAVEGSWANIKANLHMITDEGFRLEIVTRLEESGLKCTLR